MKNAVTEKWQAWLPEVLTKQKTDILCIMHMVLSLGAYGYDVAAVKHNWLN